MALLLEAATPAALAEKLSRPTQEYWSPLVCLRAGDPLLSPLFCVHAIGGNVLAYRELAERLRHRPCFALQSIALSGQNDPDPTIEAHGVPIRHRNPENPTVRSVPGGRAFSRGTGGD